MMKLFYAYAILAFFCASCETTEVYPSFPKVLAVKETQCNGKDKHFDQSLGALSDVSKVSRFARRSLPNDVEHLQNRLRLFVDSLQSHVFAFDFVTETFIASSESLKKVYQGILNTFGETFPRTRKLIVQLRHAHEFYNTMLATYSHIQEHDGSKGNDLIERLLRLRLAVFSLRDLSGNPNSKSAWLAKDVSYCKGKLQTIGDDAKGLLRSTSLKVLQIVWYHYRQSELALDDLSHHLAAEKLTLLT